MIIAFSFLSLLNEDYKTAIEKFNTIDSSNWLHYDVMDGEFVVNSTYNYELVGEINQYNKLFSDVHLMIKDPNEVISKYLAVGSDQLTFHYEAIEENKIIELINLIKSNNIKAGISIKPSTDIKVLDKYLKYLDYILVMSVEPGKGAQPFMDISLDKIKYLKNLQSKYNYLIGVDGGINNETCKLVKEAGADVIIVGSYLANNLNNETIRLLK